MTLMGTILSLLIGFWMRANSWDWVFPQYQIQTLVGGAQPSQTAGVLLPETFFIFQLQSPSGTKAQIEWGSLVFRERHLWQSEDSTQDLSLWGVRQFYGSWQTPWVQFSFGKRHHLAEEGRVGAPYWSPRWIDEFGLWRKQVSGVAMSWTYEDWQATWAFYQPSPYVSGGSMAWQLSSRSTWGWGGDVTLWSLLLPSQEVDTDFTQKLTLVGLQFFPGAALKGRFAQVRLNYLSETLRGELFGGLSEVTQNGDDKSIQWGGAQLYWKSWASFWWYASSDFFLSRDSVKSFWSRGELGVLFSFLAGSSLRINYRSNVMPQFFADHNPHELWLSFCITFERSKPRVLD